MKQFLSRLYWDTWAFFISRLYRSQEDALIIKQKKIKNSYNNQPFCNEFFDWHFLRTVDHRIMALDKFGNAFEHLHHKFLSRVTTDPIVSMYR